MTIEEMAALTGVSPEAVAAAIDALPVVAPPARTWTLELFPPLSAPMLSHNVHAKSVHTRARHVRLWRAHAYDAAVRLGLPVGLERIRIDAVIRFRDNLHRDVDNYRATLKPIVDALCGRTRYRAMAPGLGVIADDTPAYLDGPHLEFGPPLPTGRSGPLGLVVLTITDLGGERA